MTPALTPASWPRDARRETRLMVLDARDGAIHHARITELPRHLRAGDLVVVNDASTVPASLPGHTPTGDPIELRLASPTDDPLRWDAVLFGVGDWRTRTEHRPPPPTVRVGEVLRVAGRFDATVTAVSPLSPRLVSLRMDCSAEAFWRAVFEHGRPVQYAHLRDPLPLWHASTAYAGRAWAVEMPSAGRPLDLPLLRALREEGVAVARLTHAAGLSATGDDTLDARLPLPERYDIPRETVDAIARTRGAGGRVVAVGTSVVRALEGCVQAHGALRAGDGVTDLRAGPGTPRRVADAVLSGMHEPGTSHYALLRAFAPAEMLERATRQAAARGYLGHEFGDACLVIGARGLA